jgi:L,D-transpeptidase catalytic domain
VNICRQPIICFLATFLFLNNVNAAIPHIDTNRTKIKAKEALLFCKNKGYNTTYCILIDMSLPSGVKRFMIWDFRKNTILASGLVSHGCGINPWSGIWSKDKPTFSNVANSHCSSLGKYQVDDRAASAWGIHIKYYLKGLESTNSNAYVRDVVLHSWEKVPDEDVYPIGTPEDWGCPAVSNNTMKTVDALLHKQKKHLLLWIYN